MKTTYTEEELVVLLKQKNEVAFNYLYNHYSGALYGVVLRIVSSKEYTEEVIQDVFVKIWNSIDQYNAPKGRFYTWIINIARHTAIDYIKSKNFQNELKNQTVTDFVYSLKESADGNISDYIGFGKVLERLDPDKRELIHLAYFRDIHRSKFLKNLKFRWEQLKQK